MEHTHTHTYTHTRTHARTHARTHTQRHVYVCVCVYNIQQTYVHARTQVGNGGEDLKEACSALYVYDDVTYVYDDVTLQDIPPGSQPHRAGTPA